MKIAVVILSALLAQASASFFSELANSISSVQSGIGKLLSDATVDLKFTIDCTVYAMQQAFSDDGIVQGYQKCQENNSNTVPLLPLEPAYISITPSVAPTPTYLGSRIIKPTNKEQTILESTPKAIDTKQNYEEEKKSVESYLSGFVSMKYKLDHEFEDLSKHVKEDLINIENEQKQKPIEDVMEKNDESLEEKIINNNSTDNKIHEVLDNILTKLDKNNADKFDIKDEIKSVLTNLELHINKKNVGLKYQMWKEKELKSLNDIRNLLNKQDKVDTIENCRTPTNSKNTTKNIKEVADTESVESTEICAKSVPAPVTVSPTRKSHPTPNPPHPPPPPTTPNVNMVVNEKTYTDKIDLKDETKSVLTDMKKNKNQTNLDQEYQTQKEKELETLNDIRDMLKKPKKEDTIKQKGTLINTRNTTKAIEKVLDSESVPDPVTVSFTRKTRTTTPAVRTTTAVLRTKIHVERTTTPVVRTNTPIIGKTIHVVSTTTPVVCTTTPIVSTTTSVTSTTSPVVHTTTPRVGTTTHIVSTTTPVLHTKTHVERTTTPVVRTTTPIIGKTTAVVRTSTPIVSTTTSVASTTTPVVRTTTPIVSTTTHIVSTTTPVVRTTTPIVGTMTRAMCTTTPVVRTTTPVVRTTTPVVQTTTQVMRPTNPVIRRTTKTIKQSFIKPNDCVTRDKAHKLATDSNKAASLMDKILKHRKSASKVRDPELLAVKGKHEVK